MFSRVHSLSMYLINGSVFVVIIYDNSKRKKKPNENSYFRLTVTNKTTEAPVWLSGLASQALISQGRSQVVRLIPMSGSLQAVELA